MTARPPFFAASRPPDYLRQQAERALCGAVMIHVERQVGRQYAHQRHILKSRALATICVPNRIGTRRVLNSCSILS